MFYFWCFFTGFQLFSALFFVVITHCLLFWYCFAFIFPFTCEVLRTWVLLYFVYCFSFVENQSALLIFFVLVNEIINFCGVKFCSFCEKSNFECLKECILMINCMSVDFLSIYDMKVSGFIALTIVFDFFFVCIWNDFLSVFLLFLSSDITQWEIAALKHRHFQSH